MLDTKYAQIILTCTNCQREMILGGETNTNFWWANCPKCKRVFPLAAFQIRKGDICLGDKRSFESRLALIENNKDYGKLILVKTKAITDSLMTHS